MIRAAADTNCILFERTHVRSRLSCVEKLGIIALQLLDHRSCQRGDTAHALQEIQSCSFTAQYSAAVTDENTDDIAFSDLVAVLEVGAKRGVVAEHLEDSLKYVKSAEDAVLLADQIDRYHKRLRHDRLCRYVIGSDVFAQGAHDIVVPKDRIKYTIVHRNLCPFS